jgi:hypothetical protein
MKHALWMLLLCAFARCPRIYAASCPTNQPKDENALVEIEKTWAQALEQHDANTLTCILADEFEDTATMGSYLTVQRCWAGRKNSRAANTSFPTCTRASMEMLDTSGELQLL